MIKIDALYLLLLIELSCILTGCVVYLLLKNGKYRTNLKNSRKDLRESRQALEELRKQLALLKNCPSTMPSTRATIQQAEARFQENTTELAALKAELRNVQEKFNGKVQEHTQLQAKFNDLEKEYLILYHQKKH